MIRSLLTFATTILLLKIAFDAVTLRPISQIQYAFQQQSQPSLAQEDRRTAVKREFLHAWHGYKDHVWMADSLMSVSGDRKEQFCDWSATLVDSLDTLWRMSLKSELDQAVEAVTLIEFTGVSDAGEIVEIQSSEPLSDLTPFSCLVDPLSRFHRKCTVNLFESVIRYLGGMLSAYDLSGDQRLKAKLVDLGQMLHRTWRTKNGMPCSYYDPIEMVGNQKPVASHDVPLADIGSFYRDLSRSNQVTGDHSFYQTVETMTGVLHRTQNGSAVPGVWPERVDAAAIEDSTLKLPTREHAYSLGALSDSAYEYLVKENLMLGGLTTSYKQMWDAASTAIRDSMLFRASIPDWETRDALFFGIIREEGGQQSLEARTQHLACFASGMFAMSARMFDQPADMEICRALTGGCVWAYEHNTVTGIMPDTFSLLPCPVLDQQCEWNETSWNLTRHNPSSVPDICGGRVNNCAGSVSYPDGYLASIDTRYNLRPKLLNLFSSFTGPLAMRGRERPDGGCLQT